MLTKRGGRITAQTEVEDSARGSQQHSRLPLRWITLITINNSEISGVEVIAIYFHILNAIIKEIVGSNYKYY